MNRAIFAAAALLLVASPAMSHDWFPYECCSDRDCRELRADETALIEERDGGYHLWDGRFIAYGDKRIKQAPVEGWFLCESPYSKEILCFYPNKGGS